MPTYNLTNPLLDIDLTLFEIAPSLSLSVLPVLVSTSLMNNDLEAAWKGKIQTAVEAFLKKAQEEQDAKFAEGMRVLIKNLDDETPRSEKYAERRAELTKTAADGATAAANGRTQLAKAVAASFPVLRSYLLDSFAPYLYDQIVERLIVTAEVGGMTGKVAGYAAAQPGGVVMFEAGKNELLASQSGTVKATVSLTWKD